ncbi:hypothetical protein ULVI_12000 [Cochleicola gelatinilyticus]|uniref:Uncharacterized protein n=2 Tax=Cochleicola gelatinilyticus TaxID=1763537 RepID=A0A167H442_9FLAO|nr:hypothetical protein ULVI_12000 [Cochleicola gelatinilyticus]
MNMGDCFLSYRISYLKEMKVYDNNGDFSECGPSLKASWSLVTNTNGSFIKVTGEQLPKLFNIPENYKYFQIDSLSEEILNLRFEHAQFSGKKSIIIDHFVPENALVENRDFHY